MGPESNKAENEKTVSGHLKRGVMCDVCGGYNYELLGCCSGHECGCMGQPVDTRPCPKCNADGKKKASLEAQKDWPWFFLTEEEWNKYLEEKKNNEAIEMLKWVLE